MIFLWVQEYHRNMDLPVITKHIKYNKLCLSEVIWSGGRHLNQLMSIWFLSHCGALKTQASMHKHAEAGPLSAEGNLWLQMRVWLQIQGLWVWSRPGPILSWKLIMIIFPRPFSSLPLIYSRRVVVSYKRKYVHKVLVNHLFKLAQEKSVVRRTDCPYIAVYWDIKQQNKQTCRITRAFAALLLKVWM